MRKEGHTIFYKDKYIVKRRTFTHDEVQFSCHPDVADEIGKLCAEAIERAGEMLGMNIKMEGEYKIGKNWCETH